MKIAATGRSSQYPEAFIANLKMFYLNIKHKNEEAFRREPLDFFSSTKNSVYTMSTKIKSECRYERMSTYIQKSERSERKERERQKGK